jgi:hypothetical protein
MITIWDLRFRTDAKTTEQSLRSNVNLGAIVDPGIGAADATLAPALAT